METKQCPYCGGEIMSTAKKCKHCGEWLEERPRSTVANSTTKQTETTSPDVEIKNSNTKKIIFFIIGALVLAFVIWLIVMKNQKSDWEKAMEQYNQSGYVEEDVTTVDEMPYYGEGQVCPYDGVPDGENNGEIEQTSPYETNSSANAWE